MSGATKKSAAALKLSTGGTLINSKIDGDDSYLDRTWYRGEDARYYPEAQHLLDEKSAIRHILDGWLPDAPLINGNTKVTAFGSCFAVHISNWMANADYNILTASDGPSNDAYIVKYGDGMVNSFVMREQFEWALENRVIDDTPWFGRGTEAFELSEDVRVTTERIFRETDVFILTLGLSEVWYDDISGKVFWRAVPEREFKSDRHRFRTSTVAENTENLREIYKLIRKHRPEAKIVFTLSPIPLAATFRDVFCVTANRVSKAILRAALDEFMSDVREDGHAYYWPSYEIVQAMSGSVWTDELRHIKTEVLDYIMTLFEHCYCSGTKPRMSLLEAWIRARASAGTLPDNLPKLLNGVRPDQLDLLHQRVPGALIYSQDWCMVLRRLMERFEHNDAAQQWLERALAEPRTVAWTA